MQHEDIVKELSHVNQKVACLEGDVQNVSKDIKEIKENHLPHIFVALGELAVKQKYNLIGLTLVVTLLAAVLGVVLT